MSAPFDFDVFISYSRADIDRVTPIAEALRKEGLNVWFDHWILQPGADLRNKIIVGVKSSRKVLLCLTKSALVSEWTELERTLTLFHNPNNRNGRLIPLLLEDIALPDGLAHLEHIDGSNFGAATLNRIVDLCKSQSASTPAKESAEKQYQARLLPPLHNMPSRRNLNFCGRDALLTLLREGFSAEGREGSIQVVQGLGGIGKTQLSLEYVYRYGRSYQLVWWIKAQFPETARENYFSLAGRLKFQTKDARDKSTIWEVQTWFETHSDWLLIFDNAESPAAIQDLVPRAGAGHILITTRDQRWNGEGRKVAIDVLARANSIEHLIARTGQTNRQEQDRLADLLGDLPLALDQAASFILETSISVGEYIHLFEEDTRKLLSAGTPSEGYEHRVATTWNLAFQRIRENHPSALDLQSVVSHCRTDTQPRSLFLHRLEALPASLRSKFDFADAIGWLRAFSLITATDETIFMHRLVRECVREEQDSGSSTMYKEIAGKLHERQDSIDRVSRRIADIDEEDVNKLAAFLADFSPALDVAAMYLLQSQALLPSYLSLLQQRASAIVRSFPRNAASEAAVELALDLARDSQPTIDLLALISYADTDAIFVTRLSQAPSLPDSLRLSESLSSAIDLSSKYSLISVQLNLTKDQTDSQSRDGHIRKLNYADASISMAPWIRKVVKRQEFVVSGAAEYRKCARFLTRDAPPATIPAKTGGREPAYHTRFVSLSHFQGQNEVLRNITMDIPFHRVTAFIGPDLSGPSALLRLLAGVSQPATTRTVGSIERDTECVNRLALVTGDAAIRDESILHSFNWRLRLMWGRSLGRLPSGSLDQIEKSLRRAALWDGVKDKLHSSVLSLSVCQQRQLELAHALCADPGMLLIDSLALSLDPISLAKIGELLEVLKTNCTIVLSTHNLEFAARTADHTAFFLDGTLVEFDKTVTIFKNPSKKDTEDFITKQYY